MSFNDALIIYLAAGSPFAVLRFFEVRTRRDTFASLLLSAFTLIFWLPELFYSGLGRLIGKVHQRVSADYASLDAGIAREVESFFSSFNPPPGRFSRIAILLEAYTSLGQSLTHPEDSVTYPADFFAAAGREDTDVAAICMARRNRSKIERHFRQTSESLRLELTEGVRSGKITPTALAAVDRIARLFGDEELFSISESVRSVSRRAA